MAYEELIFNAQSKEYETVYSDSIIPTEDTPIAVPNEISKRQFYQQLAIEGLITEAEALSVIQSGVLPAAMESFISQLPTDMQFSTRMLLAGAQTFERGHAMSQAFEAHMNFTEAQVDQIWIDASKL